MSIDELRFNYVKCVKISEPTAAVTQNRNHIRSD